jgi:uncharacterized protein (TIGR00255 family)
MTGFGNARTQDERSNITVEIRTVNNRYLKVLTKCSDAYAPLEGRIEKLVRGAISRGTVTVSVRLDRAGSRNAYTVDDDVLQDYYRQVSRVSEHLRISPPSDVTRLLLLPGVVTDRDSTVIDIEADWPLIQAALEEALHTLQAFRREEGHSMADDLRLNNRLIAERLAEVEAQAPQVVRDFRDRLLERVRELLQQMDAGVDQADIIREVSIFAERCDINEEITRLRCHLDQFEAFLNEDVSMGRKLEFLSQEMFREVNTIGSKANSVPIAHCVVDMKAAVEKIREILQNVE